MRCSKSGSEILDKKTIINAVDNPMNAVLKVPRFKQIFDNFDLNPQQKEPPSTQLENAKLTGF